MSGGLKGTTMQRHDLSRMALAIAAAALLAGCSTNAPSAASEDPKVASAAQPGKAAVPAEAIPPVVVAPPATAPAEAPALENAAFETTVPFILTLSGPATLPDTGAVEITAKITAAHELKVPATLSIALPKGASLAAGKDSEAMTSIPGGETTRVFKVKLASKLDQPIRIILDAKAPSGATGAHAERSFPADMKPAAAKPASAIPPPPVGRPGAAAPAKH